MKAIRVLTALLCAGVAVYAQEKPLLSGKAALDLYTRDVQLMESTSVAIPDLNRAAAPILENARQAVTMMKETNGALNGGLTYTLLTNIRAYIALIDTMQKPYPFPEEAGRQLGELRDSSFRIDAHFRELLQRKERQIRNPDRDNLARYAEANARLSAPAEAHPRVIFLGDSITDGWRLNEYFTGADYVNRGISGQITGEMLGRMMADVINLKPTGVLILAGTNDIGIGVPLSTIENNLTMIADLADTYKIKPIFASLLPVSDYHQPQIKRRPPELINSLNKWLYAFCVRRNYTYVDYFSHLVDTNGYLQKDMSDDGLHPNSAGYRIMAPLAQQAIQATLKGTAQPRQRHRRLF